MAIHWINSFLNKLERKRFATLGLADLDGYIMSLIRERVISLSSEQALRFLFQIDASLYSLEGEIAVKYGKGTHPKHYLMKYHDFFVKRIHENERILDIGCGIGAVAWDVAEKSGAEVIGIDLNDTYINFAREHYSHPHVNYLLGNALFDLPDQEFDAVILSNVLEHLSDRSRFLHQVQIALKPKRFLIRVPLFERDWRVPLKRELGVEWRLDLTHEIEYTQDSFSNEILDAGMRIIYQETRWGEIWAEVVANDTQS